ncbi:Ynf [Agrobacterium tumefaciens str. B6]|uniref:Ynf n=2 Tax=Agrobacterium tumefaciens TaxID=358 RepID=Q9JN14_AGRTU|nr:ynf [Agrobacterium tumefaciens]CVI25428.1 Ynf [Agrobacterium tumefaciens str. B6]
MNEDILMPAKRGLTMRQLRQMLRFAGNGASTREIAVRRTGNSLQYDAE